MITVKRLDQLLPIFAFYVFLSPESMASEVEMAPLLQHAESLHDQVDAEQEQCTICFISLDGNGATFGRRIASNKRKLDKECACAALYCQKCPKSLSECPMCRASVIQPAPMQGAAPRRRALTPELIRCRAFLDAARTGNTNNVLRSIIAAGVDVNTRDSERNDATALMLAIQYRHYEVVEALFRVDGIEINVSDNRGKTTLMYAIETGNARVINKLLSHRDIDVNASDNEGQTAIMFAAAESIDAQIIGRILAMVRHINAQNNAGETALIWAAKSNNLVAIDLLKRVDGLNANLVDRNGDTALIHAAKHGNRSAAVIELLTIGTIDVNVQNHAGETALIWAAKSDYLIAIDLLKQVVGFNANLVDRNGDTALIHAARHGNRNDTITRLLRIREIDVNVRNHAGQNAIMLASEHDQESVDLLLRAPGIDLTGLPLELKIRKFGISLGRMFCIS